MTRRPVLVVLNLAPVLLFAAVFGVFGMMSGKFLEVRNLSNILVQSSAVAIVAIGMTFVLLTAGVDLSVGSVMFVAVVIGGRLIYDGYPLAVGMLAACGVGTAAGALNGFFIARFRIVAFVVTLATLYVGRGFGLWFTQTRAMNMPEAVTELGAARWLGVPVPVIAFAAIGVLAHVVLTRTPFGRQVYAVGHDPEAARRAGVNVPVVLAVVYTISGLLAAISGLVSLTQTGALSPTFGDKREFVAIAAAVLGGTSLFGGRGSVFPGTILGAILMQSVENGLVILNADPYFYPLVTSAIIFAAVLTDSLRSALLARESRRRIRSEDGGRDS